MKLTPADIEAIADAVVRKLSMESRPAATNRVEDFKTVFATGGVEGLKSFVKNMPPSGRSTQS